MNFPSTENLLVENMYDFAYVRDPILSELLQICACCKKIRDTDDY